MQQALLPFLLALSPATQQDEVETVYYDGPAANGELTGGSVQLEVDWSARSQRSPAAWQTLSYLGGPPANRVDVVFVGDGYTQAQLGTYAAHVDSQVAAYFAQEPFKRYAAYYNVHRVDVVSNESGVDNDPSQGVMKDTALDMGFWCGGIERLLCVSVGKAYSYADNAPDVDLVAALANSTKYGGAGYPGSDLATASGGNGSATQVLLHEFGHALGDLADEYTYGGPTVYTGPEPSERNVSIYDAAEMANLNTKWAPWLGFNDPAFDGLISTYEGAKYSQQGIYRPTANSLMRNLGRPFNLPSIESILIEVYKVVDPIDDASPDDVTYTTQDTLFVTPLAPVGHPLSIQWFLDGAPIPGATNPTLDLSTLGLGGGTFEVSVEVVDGTSWVRDEAARDLYMRQTLTYEVESICGNGIVTYCTAKTTSCGVVPVIAGDGVPSATSTSGFQVTGTAAGYRKIGLLLYSPNGRNVPATPFQGGFLCIAPQGLRRTVAVQAEGGVAGFCLSFFAIDMNAFAAGLLGGNPATFLTLPGTQVDTQWWGRDTPSAGSYLSDALEYTTCP